MTTFCAEQGISRETFYAIKRRAAEEGQAAALGPRTRRPRSSPNRTADDVKAQAIGVRVALEQSGLDHGPISVHDKMWYSGMAPVPSTAALSRIFRDAGVARVGPRKKPRASFRTHVTWGETSEAAIAVVKKGIAAHGVPQRLLTDNGAALNPSQRGAVGQLVTYVTRLGA